MAQRPPTKPVSQKGAGKMSGVPMPKKKPSGGKGQSGGKWKPAGPAGC